MTAENDDCPMPGRVDGTAHSWRFDGDDPYLICAFCGEVRDALDPDRVIKPGQDARATE